MKRMPFERPTEHYDESIYHVDEQICHLLKKRKELSSHNPGYPPFEYIEKWAAEFGFYSDFLKSIFYSLGTEESFKPVVEPTGFRKHIPVLKSWEEGEFFYTVNSVRQYQNASVLTFHMDGEEQRESGKKMALFELDLGEAYDCRMGTGGSTSGHYIYTYLVSPPLPDDLKGMVFTFREFRRPFKNQPTGREIVIRVD
ncbi:hypothetical protein MJA45_23480 [Paenibacillus aurantius]|uniref:Uncharacterized protein n=1 Tax=Paenibacillus aurantius TaxID=2918900 RepID=A0AA96LCH6_9BACL|nr:hypothetical protein [Paenibacillus aurantius]WNQ10548.1 hypothetical protein MJA45_23480 [Paenibacillus aurantius]